MKRKIWRMAAALFAAIFVYGIPAQALDVSARSAILMDADSGAILWEKNAREQHLIASTTKIMTALVVLEHADLQEQMEIPEEAVGIEGSSMYLRAGERLTVEELVYGLMLSSGNDAAVALSIHLSGSPEAFAAEMNRKAAELQLTDTHFANPNGLDSAENYSNAYDLARLAAAAMENQDFRRIVSAKSYACEGHSMTNHNKLLWQYPGAVGVKTGYTKQAGRLLVGAAEQNGRRLISVTIQAPSDWEDHQKLLDYGFSQYTEQELVGAGQTVGALPVISGQQATVALKAEEPISWFLLPEEQAELRLYTPPFLYAPVEQGRAVGTLQALVHGKVVGQTTLYTEAAVDQLPKQPGFWERILQHGTE